MITKLVRIARATTLLAVLLSGWVFAQTPSTEQSSILVTITPDRAIVRVGDTVHCSFVVRNTGDLIVSSLTLEDNSGNGTIALDKSELARGEEASGEFYYQVPKSALPGPFKISVTAVGKDKYNRDVKANAYTEMPIASLFL